MESQSLFFLKYVPYCQALSVKNICGKLAKKVWALNFFFSSRKQCSVINTATDVRKQYHFIVVNAYISF